VKLRTLIRKQSVSKYGLEVPIVGIIRRLHEAKWTDKRFIEAIMQDLTFLCSIQVEYNIKLSYYARFILLMHHTIKTYLMYAPYKQNIA
jgi:hypothetical protein